MRWRERLSGGSGNLKLSLVTKPSDPLRAYSVHSGALTTSCGSFGRIVNKAGSYHLLGREAKRIAETKVPAWISVLHRLATA